MTRESHNGLCSPSADSSSDIGRLLRLPWDRESPRSGRPRRRASADAALRRSSRADGSSSISSRSRRASGVRGQAKGTCLTPIRPDSSATSGFHANWRSEASSTRDSRRRAASPSRRARVMESAEYETRRSSGRLLRRRPVEGPVGSATRACPSGPPPPPSGCRRASSRCLMSPSLQGLRRPTVGASPAELTGPRRPAARRRPRRGPETLPVARL